MYLYFRKKNAHEKINNLNKNIDNKLAKSDLYIEYESGDFVGWSVSKVLMLQNLIIVLIKF